MPRRRGGRGGWTLEKAYLDLNCGLWVLCAGNFVSYNYPLYRWPWEKAMVEGSS